MKLGDMSIDDVFTLDGELWRIAGPNRYYSDMVIIENLTTGNLRNEFASFEV